MFRHKGHNWWLLFGVSYRVRGARTVFVKFEEVEERLKFEAWIAQILNIITGDQGDSGKVWGFNHQSVFHDYGNCPVGFQVIKRMLLLSQSQKFGNFGLVGRFGEGCPGVWRGWCCSLGMGVVCSWCPWDRWRQSVNTLRPRQMAAIFQTTFSNAFSWMKMYEFRLIFY